MNPEQRRSLISSLDRPLTPDDLHAIAQGPLMDANRIYLPAGKMTEAEYRARQREIIISEERI